jgi:CDP-diacylglycerol--glycerol-3-phosphate 3-phosphatidyltransferase
MARIVMIPAFVALLATADNAYSWAAGAVFLAAGISDQVDGWLARQWHVESTFGKFADPLADRLMIDSAVIVLVLRDRLPWPALAVIVARDALLLVGTRFVLPRGYEFSVSFLGKLATWVLYAGIGFTTVTHKGTDWSLYTFWSGLTLAVAAGVLYIASAYRQIRGGHRVEVTEA